jgi:hypothetical protein
MLLTKDLTLAEKRIAVLDLLRHREIPRDRFDAVHDYLTISETFRLLSSDIGNSAWIAGKSPSSIQPNWILQRKPAIKPVHGGLDGRTDHFLEDYDDQVQYIIDQLAETAETLRNQQFFTYCRSVGLVAEIDKKS